MAHPRVAAPLAEPDARRRRAHQSSAQPALSRPRQPWSLPPPAIAIPRTPSIIISTLTYDLYHILSDIQARAKAVIEHMLCNECGNFRHGLAKHPYYNVRYIGVLVGPAARRQPQS